MKPDLIIGHGPFLGHTGYAAHTREFFTSLSHLYNLRVNNVTHSQDISYLTQYQKDLLFYEKNDSYEIGTSNPNLNDYKDILNIVLHTTNGNLFYANYTGSKIAYNVWESTRQPEGFFKQLLTFDQLWVPSEWQRTVSIEQGYPHERVKVVPEGIDPAIFKPSSYFAGKPFTFFVAGRWEYRKSINEIVTQFVIKFKDNKDVRLIINADNPFPSDGMKTTEERIEKLNLGDYKCKIEIKHFMPFNEYLHTLKTCHCFVSCARAEGWNLPLLEAIACAAPSICSDYGAQLDFAKGIAHPVNIMTHLPPRELFGWNDINCPGTWCEPDYEHLGYQMKYVFENSIDCRFRAELGAAEIRRKFSWKRAASIARNYIHEFKKESEDTVLIKPETININNHFHDGAFLEMTGTSDKNYLYRLIDEDNDLVEYEAMLPTNRWIKSGRKYFVNWKCEIKDGDETIYNHKFNAKGKKVMISFESSALGDTLAWIPYVELFRVKHNCAIFISTFWNRILNEAYGQFKFVNPGHIESDIYALFRIKVENNDPNVHKRDWRTIPLQKVSADILGVEYKELKPKVNLVSSLKHKGKRYVAISEASTAGCKQWQHPGAWQEIINYLRNKEYDVMVVSRERSELSGIIDQTNHPIETTIKNISMCDFFIGVSSGLSWLAHALSKPVVLISGCTKEWNEFQSCKRVINKQVCHGCMNDIRFEFDKGDWWWCPENKEMICTKSITPEMVIASIDELLQWIK